MVGIRYPEDLLPEVKERNQQEWISEQEKETIAAAMARGVGSGAGAGTPLSPGGGSVSRVRVEEPTPIDSMWAAKAVRAPNTMMSFFQKKETTKGDGGDGSGGGDEKNVHEDGSSGGGGGGSGPPLVGECHLSASQPTSGGGGGREGKRAPGSGSAGRGGATAKRAKANPLGFTSTHIPINLIQTSSVGAGVKRLTSTPAPVERQTCPICNFAFPRSALNNEVNAHLDKCITETVL